MHVVSSDYIARSCAADSASCQAGPSWPRNRELRLGRSQLAEHQLPVQDRGFHSGVEQLLRWDVEDILRQHNHIRQLAHGERALDALLA